MSGHVHGNAIRCCILQFGFFAAVSSCSGLRIVAGPYLQNPSETSMTVMWITDEKCTGWVEYGAGGSTDQKAFGSQHGLIDADRKIHRVTVRGLFPGGGYTYRVCSKEILEFRPYKVSYGETISGDIHNFTTLSKGRESISFIVLNDTHERDDVLASLIKASASKPYDFVFLNGDILGHIEDEPQIIEHVLKPCSELFAKEIPFLYVRGNHEARGRFARMLADYLCTPEGRYYYSFDHGCVHFIVMDGGEDKEDTSVEYSGLADFDRYREEQRLWLEKEMRTEAFRNAAFRVVVVHMPAVQSDEWHGPTDMCDKWGRLFNEGRIDLMISGHLHSYMVVEPEAGIRDYPIVIGGGPTAGKATVIRIDANRKRLEATMTRDDGEVVGRRVVQQAACPTARAP